MGFKITNKGLYWGLIVTFGLLYVLVAFVSTLHAIDFFKLANITSLAVLLGIAYEVGQATVLFSILMTKNKEKFLPWLLMILLTALQVTANVYASFKHMSLSGNEDWTYWYTSILKIFGVQGGNAETYQVIISWISGALLPIVALGMTALVAQNIKLITEEDNLNPSVAEEDLEVKTPEPKKEETNKRNQQTEEEIKKIKTLMSKHPIETGILSDELKKTISPGLELEDDLGDSPREQIAKILNDSSVMEDTDLLFNKNEDQKMENVAQNEVESEPQMVENEPQHIDDVLTDIVNEVIDVPKPIVEPPKTVEVEPTPPVKYESSPPIQDSEPPEERIETEEERQERLRNIAREKLKKK